MPFVRTSFVVNMLDSCLFSYSFVVNFSLDGELTVGSMQKMVELMKTYTNFSSASRFIDVGSGLGKPNIHVCQDPKVEFSYGIEMEMSRWMLGMANLQAVLKAAKNQDDSQLDESERIGTNCMFDHGNIMDAETFDPFTHVYAFSIGYVCIVLG